MLCGHILVVNGLTLKCRESEDNAPFVISHNRTVSRKNDLRFDRKRKNLPRKIAKIGRTSNRVFAIEIFTQISIVLAYSRFSRFTKQNSAKCRRNFCFVPCNLNPYVPGKRSQCPICNISQPSHAEKNDLRFDRKRKNLPRKIAKIGPTSN